MTTPSEMTGTAAFKLKLRERVDQAVRNPTTEFYYATVEATERDLDALLAHATAGVERLREAALEVIECQELLLVCYRVGKSPGGLIDRTREAKEVFRAALSAAKGTT